MKLTIAEKPSMAQTTVAALGVKEKKDGYIEGGGCLISWCIEYLVQLAEAVACGEQYKKWSFESLPTLPEKWQYAVDSDKGKQLKTLKELMYRADVSEVVNACDAGREGKLIFRFVCEAVDCKKPMCRLWTSSMEDEAIRADFASLKDGQEYDALFTSALCRTEADWLIGINATRFSSCLYGKTLNVGRVQTLTLEMLTDRDAAISHFQKEKYYHVRLDLSGVEMASGRISDKAEADALKGACETETVACVSPTREKEIAAPPKLFDLTSLQRKANRIFGYTAKQIFNLVQSFYEKRLLTYPRTDSSLLTDDMGGATADTIVLLCEKLPFMASTDFTPEVVKVLDGKEASDHHAIIPAMELVKADPNALSESGKNILTLAGVRLLFATAEPHTYKAVTVIFSCAEADSITRGKTALAEGWKELQRRHWATLEDKPEAEDGENADVMLLKLSEGQGSPNLVAKVTEHTTTPLKPHSEAGLLSAMERTGNGDTDPDAERRGLGAPATRAAVIEKLVKSGFAECKGKQPIPTKNGDSLICILPDILTSLQLTAEWENNLTRIAKGAVDSGEFLSGIEAMVRELVQTHVTVLDGKKDLFREEKPFVSKCSRCGSLVHKGKKNYYCSNKECASVMWKDDHFFEEHKIAFSAKIAAAFPRPGKVNAKKLYFPRTGKTYSGTIVLADTGEKYVNYRTEMQRN